ncbi:MAG TPA: hypothetical protein VGR28_09100 [Candidatus Thermoplasmatota archaeon]|nr:hypothetical protein [Candidatus Thermoplasmatota archaeon]
MHARSAPFAQASLSAAAGAAAVAYGASWLGLGWHYEVSVQGAHFALDPSFPLGLLAAVLMGAAAGAARGEGRHRGAALGLSLGGGAIYASALWLLLVWAPGGAPDGQRALLDDATRVGFALLALSLPLALPSGVRPLVRGAAMALGIVLAPVLLFPEHVAQAGLSDVRTTLPMLLFFLQGALALSGLGAPHGKSGWGRRTRASAAEPEAHFMRALMGPRPGRRAKRAPRLGREPMFHDTRPMGPEGPARPRPPLPAMARVKRAVWWFQF